MPRNLSFGLATDFPVLRKGTSGELNALGTAICAVARRVNPWLITGGMLVIARKPALQ